MTAPATPHSAASLMISGVAEAGAVGLAGGVISERARGLGEALHPQQHAAHVGMVGDHGP